MKVPLQPVRDAHDVFDLNWRRALANGDEPVTCRKGCHACCAEPLTVNEGEAKLIMRAIPKSELAGVTERTREWIDRAEASGLLQQETPHVLDYMSAKLACPLLKGGLCLVYADRPLGCRAHCAIRDPALCHSPETRLKQKYASCLELNQVTGMSLALASKKSDHLGAYLTRWLLRRKVVSAAQAEWPVEIVGVRQEDGKGVLALKRTAP